MLSHNHFNIYQYLQPLSIQQVQKQLITLWISYYGEKSKLLDQHPASVQEWKCAREIQSLRHHLSWQPIRLRCIILEMKLHKQFFRPSTTSGRSYSVFNLSKDLVSKSPKLCKNLDLLSMRSFKITCYIIKYFHLLNTPMTKIIPVFYNLMQLIRGIWK